MACSAAPIQFDWHVDGLTPGDVARRMHITASAVRYYADQGLLPHQRTQGNQRGFHADVLCRVAMIQVIPTCWTVAGRDPRRLDRAAVRQSRPITNQAHPDAAAWATTPTPLLTSLSTTNYGDLQSAFPLENLFRRKTKFPLLGRPFCVSTHRSRTAAPRTIRVARVSSPTQVRELSALRDVGVDAQE